MCASKDQYFSNVMSKVEVGAILIEFYTFSLYRLPHFANFAVLVSTCSAFISSGCS